MSLTLELVTFSALSLYITEILPASFDEDIEEYNQVTPGIDFPVKCPEKSKHYAKIYYEEDYLKVSDVYHNDDVKPLSDNGYYLVKNVTVNDSNDYVCVYKEKEIAPYTIHLMVIAIDPFDYLNHTQIFDFAGTPPIPDALLVKEEEVQLKKAGGTRRTGKEEIVAINDDKLHLDNEIEARDEEYPDEPQVMAHNQLGQFGDYNVGPAVNTTGLVPPSAPKVKRISPSSVEVSWSIKLNKGSPVDHYLVHHLTSLSLGVGGGSFWKCSKKIPPSTKWCVIDKLMPKYWYRFRVAAVFFNKQEIKVFGNRSEWLKL
ncbi:unnamed protein product [Bemisia tabaci]|uniref:Fibronectin type-III domain-containing protein n=1 Tax=Bemisia tabaci TaxID=7038 RepID=A0A9P0A4M8_BEMTA|nr:unnamed protein product [Bemisia tabaci]